MRFAFTFDVRFEADSLDEMHEIRMQVADEVEEILGDRIIRDEWGALSGDSVVGLDEPTKHALEHEAEEELVDEPPPTASVGWYPDPADVHKWRWFDGERWTERVSDEDRPLGAHA